MLQLYRDWMRKTRSIGRTAIYHFILQSKEIKFQLYTLGELRLSYQIKYAEKGHISYIKVSRSPQNAENDDNTRKPTFTFRTKEGIEGALKFLSKFLSNAEGK
jgi:hypothetical protein